jgi:rhamnosyltransferase subunit B
LSSRFLLTTIGSLGDLHPYLAVGLGLRARGHAVTIATSEIYRAKVEGEGLGFAPLRPDVSFVLHDPAVMRQALHPRRGPEFIFRELVLPYIEQTYEDTLAAAAEADLLVGHGIAFATPVVAELLGKPWISVVLQPAVFFSKYDPPAISGVPWLNRLEVLGPWFWEPFLQLLRRVVRYWGKPLNAFRRRLGLREMANPLLDDMLSPYGTQAWFSRVFAARQADWPGNVTVTGFPFYDKLSPGAGLSDRLAAFLAEGPAPVVFTLGSSAVRGAGSFYEESYEAIRRMGRRAVVLTGDEARNLPRRDMGNAVFVTEYAPYSALLPHAAATVHQGGVGTTAQALRAGRPMIVVPFSNDQPDNARRVERTGAGLVVARSQYRADRVVTALERLLSEPQYGTAAMRASIEMAGEDGVSAACDGLIAATRRS